MQSDASKCPLCGAVAGESPDEELRYVCDVCGAPRVPLDDPAVRRSGKEAAPLKRADAARKARAGWRAAAVGAAVVLPFVLALSAILGLAWSATAALVAAIMLGLPAASLLGFAMARAKARGKEIQPALDAAWLSVATDIAQSATGPLKAGDLAAKLRVDTAQAEQLLALLDVNDVVRSDITEEGEIAYSSRLRVAHPAAAAAPDPDASAAEHEAAEDEAASLAAQKTLLAPVERKR